MFLHVTLQICFLGKRILAFLALKEKIVVKMCVKLNIKLTSHLKVLLFIVNIPEVPLKV